MPRKTTPPPDELGVQVEAEAVENWRRACAHRDLLRAEWEAAGQPTVAEHPNGIEYEDPLHKMLVVAERDVAARLKEIPRPAKTPGRKPVGVAGISASPAAVKRAKLKAVK